MADATTVAMVVGLTFLGTWIVIIVFIIMRLRADAPPPIKKGEVELDAPPPTKKKEVDAPPMEKFLQELAKEKPVRFTAQQLRAFTSNYSTRLGSGGFGVVYKGQFSDGVKIAVKVLEKSYEKAAEEQFMAEDAIEWEKLHEIAIGTAKGIAYLHEECQQRIIHYDIKPANVLLDANFFPKVADFGLAKLCNRDLSQVSNTGYRGTPGYSAPEWFFKNIPMTYKCDVYSFGMMLFEIVGRRKHTIMGSFESLDWFPKQVWEKYEKGELFEMIMTCRIKEKDRGKAERMSMVALWCVQDSPEARPPMSAVVKMLEGGVEIMPPPRPFNYLYSIGMNALKPPATTIGSSFSSSEENKSCWYKETTPIMAKYEIQIATH